MYQVNLDKSIFKMNWSRSSHFESFFKYRNKTKSDDSINSANSFIMSTSKSMESCYEEDIRKINEKIQQGLKSNVQPVTTESKIKRLQKKLKFCLKYQRKSSTDIRLLKKTIRKLRVKLYNLEKIQTICTEKINLSKDGEKFITKDILLLKKNLYFIIGGLLPRILFFLIYFYAINLFL